MDVVCQMWSYSKFEIWMISSIQLSSIECKGDKEEGSKVAPSAHTSTCATYTYFLKPELKNRQDLTRRGKSEMDGNLHVVWIGLNRYSRPPSSHTHLRVYGFPPSFSSLTYLSHLRCWRRLQRTQAILLCTQTVGRQDSKICFSLTPQSRRQWSRVGTNTLSLRLLEDLS